MTSTLQSEIFEQPHAIQRFLDQETETVAQIGLELAKREADYILIAARGTSEHAARYGQYVFGALNRLPVALAAPSLITKYASPPRMKNALVIGLSQSGQSPEIVQVIEEARRQNVPTVAITNDPHSPLATAAQYQVHLHAGTQQGRAATKTYTAQLAALALLAMNLTGMPPGAGPLHTIPGLLNQALQAEEQTRAAAGHLASFDHTIVIGRGYNYATAFETAFMIKELAHVQAEAYSSADFLHGPLSLAGPEFSAVLITLGDTFQDQMQELVRQLQARGARITGIGDRPQQLIETWIPVPAGIPEWLTPMVAILPGQLLAYHLALARGLDPDQPRNLRMQLKFSEY